MYLLYNSVCGFNFNMQALICISLKANFWNELERSLINKAGNLIKKAIFAGNLLKKDEML